MLVHELEALHKVVIRRAIGKAFIFARDAHGGIPFAQKAAWRAGFDEARRAVFEALDAATLPVTDPERWLLADGCPSGVTVTVDAGDLRVALGHVHIIGGLTSGEQGALDRLAEALTQPECTCGFGGFHDDINTRCERNRPQAAD